MIYIGSALVAPVANFKLHTTMMASFFRYKQGKPSNLLKNNKVDSQVHNQEEKDEESLFDKIKRELLSFKKIPRIGFFMINCCCLRWRESQKYHQILEKSKLRLEKEMDLQKFLHRQRFIMTSLLSLLKGPQTAFVDKFSQLLIRESSDICCKTTSEAELSDWGKRSIDFVSTLTSSDKRVDQNLLKIFKLRMAK